MHDLYYQCISHIIGEWQVNLGLNTCETVLNIPVWMIMEGFSTMFNDQWGTQWTGILLLWVHRRSISALCSLVAMWLCTHRWLLGAGQEFLDLSAMVVLQTLASKSNYMISSMRPSVMLLTLLKALLEQVMVMVVNSYYWPPRMWITWLNIYNDPVINSIPKSNFELTKLLLLYNIYLLWHWISNYFKSQVYIYFTLIAIVMDWNWNSQFAKII